MVNKQHTPVTQEEMNRIFKDAATRAERDLGQDQDVHQFLERVRFYLSEEGFGNDQDIFEAAGMSNARPQPSVVRAFYDALPEEKRLKSSERRTVDYQAATRQDVQNVMNPGPGATPSNAMRRVVPSKTTAYKPAEELLPDLIRDLNVGDGLKEIVTELVGHFLRQADTIILDVPQSMTTYMSRTHQGLSQADFAIVKHAVFRALSHLRLMQEGILESQTAAKNLERSMLVCAEQVCRMCVATADKEGMVSPHGIAAKCKTALKSAGLPLKYTDDLKDVVNARLKLANIAIGMRKNSSRKSGGVMFPPVEAEVPAVESDSRERERGNSRSLPVPKPRGGELSFAFDVDPDRDVAVGYEPAFDPDAEGEIEQDPAWDQAVMDVDPHVPTQAKPGSRQKMVTLAARYQEGLPLWHKDDLVDHGPPVGGLLTPEDDEEPDIDDDDEDAPINVDDAVGAEGLTYTQRIQRETIQAALQSSDARIVVPADLKS